MKNDNVVQFPINELSLIVGQYLHIEDSENEGYSQAVVTGVFDQFVIIKFNGMILRYYFGSNDDGNARYKLVIPTKDGKRVMAKKKLFGKYTTEPDMR